MYFNISHIKNSFKMPADISAGKSLRTIPSNNIYETVPSYKRTLKLLLYFSLIFFPPNFQPLPSDYMFQVGLQSNLM